MRFKQLSIAASNIKKYFEFDARPYFLNPCSGTYFKHYYVSRGWDKLWGGDNWLFNPVLILDIKDNVTMHVSRKPEYSFELDGTRHAVVIDGQFISDITSVQLNRNYQPQDVGKCVDVDLDRLINKVAPYTDPEKRYKFLLKSLETNGLKKIKSW